MRTPRTDLVVNLRLATKTGWMVFYQPTQACLAGGTTSTFPDYSASGGCLAIALKLIMRREILRYSARPVRHRFEFTSNGSLC